MGLLRKWTRHIRVQAAALGRRRRLAAVGLALAVLGGGIWLILAAIRPAAAPAAQALRPPETRDDTVFEQIARSGDLWSSQAQADKRWLAAKMTHLGQRISQFPPIASASVIIEGGQSRRGSAPQAASAAVMITLKPNARVNDRLVAAIADLVAGSCGMTRQDVRIVDSAGVSYRAADAGPTAGDDTQRLRSAEAYYSEKAQQAIAYVDNSVVSVRVACEGAVARCAGATVSVPRSYLVSALRTSHAVDGTPTDEELQNLAGAPLARIQQGVARALGLEDSAVKVEWHYDAQAAAATVAQASSWWMNRSMLLPVAAGLGLIGAGAIVLMAMFRRRRRRIPLARALDDSGVEASAEMVRGDYFGFLADVPGDEVQALLRDEHPQTVAMVLACLGNPLAAEVLAGMPASCQVEVARRIATLDRIDPDVAAEVERTLAQRLAGAPAQETRVGGVAAVSEILHRAGYATQRAVLEGLTPSEPMLAESIRQRMFGFEDIVHLPADRLGAALSGLEETELAVALRTAGPQVKEHICSALPGSTARRIRAEMERIGPVRLSDVEAAQQKVVDLVRRNEEGLASPGVKPRGVLA